MSKESMHNVCPKSVSVHSCMKTKGSKTSTRMLPQGQNIFHSIDWKEKGVTQEVGADETSTGTVRF